MNFEIICRTCSSEGELKSLFIEDTVLIADMLTEIVDLKIRKDDNFPQNICNSCLEKLKSAYEFKKHCQDVQIKFEQYLQSVHVKEEILVKEEQQFDPGDDENYSNWNDDVKSPISSPEQTVDSEEIEKSVKFRRSLKKENNKRKRKVTCNICNKNITKLHVHLRSHTKEKPYKCETCGKQFSIKCNYQRHMKIHTVERSHVCSICGHSFIQKTALNAHLQGHSDETSLTCTHCGKTYQFRHQLRYHLRLKHLDKLKPSENGEFSCDICNKNFNTQEILVTHKLLHVEKSYLCSHCGKGFVRKSGLQSHIKIHTGEKPYKCSFCEKSFSHLASYNSHQLIHTGEKPFKCSYCEKQFAHRLIYINHQLIHTGDKPYKCDVCNQSFRQKIHLKFHSFTHTGEKLFKCTLCDKSFALKGNLTVHMRTHTGETPYICSICNKGFHNSSGLKKHLKRHENNKNFRSKPPAEKVYKCTLCEKAFAFKTSLTSHMFMHSGETPYVCLVCDKGFYDSSNFSKHKKKHSVTENGVTQEKSLDLSLENIEK